MLLMLLFFDEPAPLVPNIFGINICGVHMPWGRNIKVEWFVGVGRVRSHNWETLSSKVSCMIYTTSIGDVGLSRL